MSEYLIKSLQSHWDKTACVLWFTVEFADGAPAVSVGVPLAHVAATVDYYLRQFGVNLAPQVGDVESVDGLFSSIKHAVSKAGKAATKAVKSAAKTIDKGVSKAASVIRDKRLGVAMNVVKFVPVVGQTAYAAHQSARSAVDAYDRAKLAASIVAKTGRQTLATAKAISRGKNVLASVQNLSRQVRGTAANLSQSRDAKMALAALQSVA